MRAFGLATLATLVASLCALPRHVIQEFGKRAADSDLEFSGNGADEPVRGSVRVVKVSPNFLRHSPRLHALKRGSFPAFLAMGRPGPSVHVPVRAPAASLPHLRASYTGAEARKRQGLEMWQRVMQKSEQSKEVLSLPFHPKDAGTQTCASLPFTQVLHTLLIIHS